MSRSRHPSVAIVMSCVSFVAAFRPQQVSAKAAVRDMRDRVGIFLEKFVVDEPYLLQTTVL